MTHPSLMPDKERIASLEKKVGELKVSIMHLYKSINTVDAGAKKKYSELGEKLDEIEAVLEE